MKAAVVEALDAPVRIADIPTPEPAAGQVLVRMEASGLCHTDIHAARGDWPIRPTPPFVPGHEGIGLIEAVGDGVDLPIGRRVAIPWLGHACGHCGFCVDGRETLCESQLNSGYAVDGALAEFAVADAHYVVGVPDGVSPVDAAPLTCAGLTTYKAVRVAAVVPGERVAVFGIGGLGHLAVQYARLAGALVTAVDVTATKLDLARELGADDLVDASREDPVRAIERAGGADVAIVLATASEVFAQAWRSLRRGGRLVCVGLPEQGSLTIPIFDLVLGGRSVIGSIVGTRDDLARVFALHAVGRTRVVSEIRTLDRLPASMDDVLAGWVPARVVIGF